MGPAECADLLGSMLSNRLSLFPFDKQASESGQRFQVAINVSKGFHFAINVLCGVEA